MVNRSYHLIGTIISYGTEQMSNFVLVEFINLHNFCGIPVDGVIVKISSWVKPEVKLLLSASFSLCIYVGIDSVWLSCNVA